MNRKRVQRRFFKNLTFRSILEERTYFSSYKSLNILTFNRLKNSWDIVHFGHRQGNNTHDLAWLFKRMEAARSHKILFYGLENWCKKMPRVFNRSHLAYDFIIDGKIWSSSFCIHTKSPLNIIFIYQSCDCRQSYLQRLVAQYLKSLDWSDVNQGLCCVGPYKKHFFRMTYPIFHSCYIYLILYLIIILLILLPVTG